MFRALLLTVALLFAAAPVHARPVPLEPYLETVVPGLVTIEIEIDGRKARMLLDSGAGLTLVTPDFAARIGCTPYGAASGFRMRGDRIVVRKCGERRLGVGGRTVSRDIGEFDLATLLPENAPPVDGIIGLDAFEGRMVTFGLANRRLHLDERPGRGWVEGRTRYQREMGGAGLSVFMPAQARTGTIWMLMDTGHVGDTPVFLSAGALSQLGDPALDRPVELNLSGAGALSASAVKVDGLIYDGVLGERLLRRFDIAIDLKRGRVWWRPSAAVQSP